ncbi:2Fe-2S iron-sulfur cluster-binding protein [Streptomyces albidoflavus]|uniref:2Fe-2S iron-sulfur cluster-binding protein n=1 Tax=Streptomyces albidoflavus TaxID=1886 RepID=UPI00101E6792|nr:2Fe-2S iron-sulfur cluster-binding protein [Streptomyces albidoflavus]RZE97924.1 carbon monoxide dehydrogenase [Streptomyces albidoflavus]RZE99122.1 carbon monoxide dehydrogenase [Streptomyces albidoflavus]
MTDDERGEGTGAARGTSLSWGAIPHQGGEEYDDGATAFVQLPEGIADIPLAAPGQGYVPPITVTPATGPADPAATGVWSIPGAVAGGAPAPDPYAQQAGHGPDPYGTLPPQDVPEAAPGQVVADVYPDGAQVPGADGYPQPPADAFAATDAFGDTRPLTIPPGLSPDGPRPDLGAAFGGAERAGQPHGRPGIPGQQQGPGSAGQDATGHWDFTAALDESAPPAQGGTGQWAVPLAPEDVPEESGEYPLSEAAPRTGAWAAAPTHQAPATLPGGATAPWAGEAEATAPEPAPEAAPEATAEEAPGEAQSAPDGPEAEEQAESAPEADSAPKAADAPAPEPEAEAETEAEAEGAGEEPGGAVEAAGEEAPEAGGLHDERPVVSYTLNVNGIDRPVTEAWIGESLLHVLRERLGLAGAKDGCSQGECGACAVRVDGRVVASCLVPAATTEGSDIHTVEGLGAAEDGGPGEPSDVQRALARHCAVQCGFCIPGMAMTIHDLLEGNPRPTDLETRQALSGNLCRCSGYRAILESVRDVVGEREASAEAAADVAAHDDASAEAEDGEPAGADQAEVAIPHQAGPADGEAPGHPYGALPDGYDGLPQPPPSYDTGGYPPHHGQDGYGYDEQGPHEQHGGQA